MTLANELAFITGATRGIGRAIALELGRRGARVVGTATTEAGAKAIDEYLQAAGITGRGTVLNVADGGAVEACFKAVEAAEGTPSRSMYEFMTLRAPPSRTAISNGGSSTSASSRGPTDSAARLRPARDAE